MLFTTTTQYVALAVALLAGWLFGLASHPGGKKWKQRYADEREAHALTRKEYDAKIADARRDHDTRLAEMKTRHDEIERENARLAKAVPAAPAPVQTIATRERAIPMTTRDTVTAPRSSNRGWFDWSRN